MNEWKKAGRKASEMYLLALDRPTLDLLRPLTNFLIANL